MSEKEFECRSEGNSPELNEDGVPRPAPDPKNKLYTVISLLIFAVIYIAVSVIKNNISFSYMQYLDSFTPWAETALLDEMDIEALPESAVIEYARLHKSYGDSVFYVSVLLPDSFCTQEDFPDPIIGFSYGDVVEDSRFTVYPEPDTTPDYIYGDCYVCIDDPDRYVIIYEDSEGVHSVYRCADPDSSAKELFSKCEKLT